MTHAQLKETWWIVFGLELGVMQIRDYIQRFKFTCNVERKGISSWRILEDINVNKIETNGGKLSKTVVKGHVVLGKYKQAVWACVPIIPDVIADDGHCARCGTYTPLYWQLCAKCYAQPLAQPRQAQIDV